MFMLTDFGNGRERLVRFLELAPQVEYPEALRQAFGDFEECEKELRRYIHRRRFQFAVYEAETEIDLDSRSVILSVFLHQQESELDEPGSSSTP